jgi:hypothetical protein
MKHGPGWLRGVVLVVAFIFVGNGLNYVMPHLVRMWSRRWTGCRMWCCGVERPEDLRFLDPEK